MAIVLTGASAVGKSTLAELYAIKKGMTFIPSCASRVYRENGLTVKGDIDNLSPGIRLSLQEKILDQHIKDITSVKGPWIADRSSIDMATYTMIYNFGQRVDADIEERSMVYYERCIQVANRHYNFATLVQPGIPYEASDDRPTPSALMQEVHNNFTIGLFNNSKLTILKTIIPRYMTDISDRYEALERAEAHALNVAIQLRDGATKH